MISVLVRPPVSHLGVVKLTLHDMENTLHFRPDLRFGPVALAVLIGR